MNKKQIYIGAQFEANGKGEGNHVFINKYPFKSICGKALNYDKLVKFSTFSISKLACQECRKIYLEKYQHYQSPKELSDVFDKLFKDGE